MGLFNVNRLKAVGRNRVKVIGSFRPDGAGSYVAGSLKGKGFSVAGTSPGLFTITFNEKASALEGFSCGVRGATAGNVRVQGGDYSAANKTLQLRVFTAATAAITEPVGTLPLPLGACQEQSGVALADFVNGASPTPGWSGGDQSNGIRWNNHANPDPVALQFVWPTDMKADTAATLHILAAKVGATLADAVTWKVELFNNVAAALYDADADYGGTSSAMTGDAATKTVQDETLAIAAVDIPAKPGVSVLTIQPTDGTLGTDDVILLGMYIAYTKADFTTTGQVWSLADLASDVDNEIYFEATFRDGVDA